MLPPRAAAALLLGAGGAGATTFLGLLLAQAAGGVDATARLGALLFGMLLTIPVALGLTALLRQVGLRDARFVAMAGALMWLGGLGSEVFLLDLEGGPLLATRISAVLGAAMLGAAGFLALAPARRAA